MDTSPAGDGPAPGRLPFSRAFAQAGFSRPEADAWRHAGWTDAAEAARWRHLQRSFSPEVLRALADAGTEPAVVERLLDDHPGLGASHLLARIRRYAGLSRAEIDLRERVLENLHRPFAPSTSPGTAPSA